MAASFRFDAHSAEVTQAIHDLGGVLIIPAGIVHLFTSGPLAWNGIMGFFCPLVAYSVRIISMTVVVHTRLSHQMAEGSEPGWPPPSARCPPPPDRNPLSVPGSAPVRRAPVALPRPGPPPPPVSGSKLMLGGLARGRPGCAAAGPRSRSATFARATRFHDPSWSSSPPPELLGHRVVPPQGPT